MGPGTDLLSAFPVAHRARNKLVFLKSLSCGTCCAGPCATSQHQSQQAQSSSHTLPEPHPVPAPVAGYPWLQQCVVGSARHKTSIPEFPEAGRAATHSRWYKTSLGCFYTGQVKYWVQMLGLNMVLDTESRIFSWTNIRKDPESFCCCFMEKVKSMIPFLSANRFRPCFVFPRRPRYFLFVF